MNHKPSTFWEYVRALRDQGRIDRTWKPAELAKYLDDSFKANTISAVPYNSSISMNGDKIGDYVKKGGEPKAWRVGRGLFQLVKDPDDDPETQQAQMERAEKRAEDLREKKRAARIDSEAVSTPQSRSVARPKAESPSSDIYSIVPIALTEEGRKKIESLTTEQKALAIVRGFMETAYGEDVVIEEDRDGVDLRVTIDGKTERIEVKGTKDSDIAWEKLKVSSRKQHDALVSGDATIYRVVDVHSADPRVYVLIHGEDFTLEPEPRWAVKRIPPDNERYPLRGMPYRYDRPHDPVALEDWEILQ